MYVKHCEYVCVQLLISFRRLLEKRSQFEHESSVDVIWLLKRRTDAEEIYKIKENMHVDVKERVLHMKYKRTGIPLSLIHI